MELTRRRRRAISTALALLLAVESVSVVAAAAQTGVGARGPNALPVGSPAGLVLAESAQAETVGPVRAWDAPAGGAPGTRLPAAAIAEALVVPTAQAATVAAPAAPVRASMPERSAKASTTKPASSKPSSKSGSKSGSSDSAAYAGSNHVWIPALRINRSVSFFPCNRTRPPDNRVYRWGCAGANNVYLMGHAYSVFDPLHDAYVAGRLRVGMKAWYADSKGRVRVYAVKWWKVTLPTNSSWAWAAQGRPSMTLQTCVGANSKYRLVVRLVEVGG